MSTTPPPTTALPSILRGLARKRETGETCDMCGAPIGEQHPHLAEPVARQLICSCRHCALLFSGAAEMKYRLVPEEIRLIRDFQIADELWDSLNIPVEMAYFFPSTPARKVVAFYPGPAGVTESLLTLEAWQELEEANPLLGGLRPDVEGLLVNRVGANRLYFVAPIDRFYELVGLIRLRWAGLSGGTEVWRSINGFFADLASRAVTVDGGTVGT